RRAARLARPHLLPDAEPLPPRRRNPALAPLRRHAPPQRRLRPSLQPPPQTLGPPVRRALRVLGHRRRGPSPQDDRVRPPEPGPSGPGPTSRGLALVGPSQLQSERLFASTDPARLAWLWPRKSS